MPILKQMEKYPFIFFFVNGEMQTHLSSVVK